MPQLSLKMSANLVSPTLLIIFMLFFTVILPNDFHKFVACQEDQCQPASCSPSGPIVRFPFRLKQHQPEHCGFPGFDLNCSPTNIVEFNLNITIRATNRNIPLSIALRVMIEDIDYAAQVLRAGMLNSSCLPARVTEPINSPSTSALFEMYYDPPFEHFASESYKLFNCSEKRKNGFNNGFTCLAQDMFTVYPVRSSSLITDDVALPSSCTQMYNISDVPFITMYESRSSYFSYSRLRWSEPDCGRCETQGKLCRPINNGRRSNETKCFELPEQIKKKKGISRKVIIAISVVSSFLTVTAISALCSVCILKRRKQNRIQQFLEDYKALIPTRYTYAEIKRITDKFKHRLGRGGYGTVYRGILSNEIPVAVKVLHNIKGSGEDFINEVRTIGKIHHVNVVRLIGFCADGYRRALVYELLENDSLEKYIPSLHRRKSLIGWEKLHDIALGIAKGLDYLHQGCSQRILHFDIKPQNILLDHNLNPKVADFGLAKLCSKDKSVVTMTAARGTIGYIAPEVFSRNFGRVSHKSDIYSYGMLLLDLVGGRKMSDNRGQDSAETEIYFPEWMYNQLDKGADIAVKIEKEEDNDVVKRLIIVGLWCVQWYPVDRPSTKVVIRMLEGEDMPIVPPNPFAASKSEGSTASGSDLFISAETSFKKY